MENDLKILVLSALLHDIGKSAQRANRPRSDNMQTEYLKVSNGKSTHWHTLYTDYFIENDLPLPPELTDCRSKIARLASVHHRPDEKNLSEMCLMVADCLSSGSDRISDEDNENQVGFLESRLVSVFDEVELLKHQFKSPGNAFYNLAPLNTANESIFPKAGIPKGSAKEYQEFFEIFLSELKTIDVNSGVSFYIESLITLLEKYTWCIPSSAYKTLSDISLFDHAVSTAGIAQALYHYHHEKRTIPQMKDDDAKFIFMAGDLSGIQNYIFGISKNSGRGVSKIFRARSFYIQVLVKSVLIEIQQRLGLFSVCRLIDSGGKFVILLPCLDSVKQDIEQLDTEIQNWFRKKFKGLLTLNLAWHTEMKQSDFSMEIFQTKMEESEESLEKSKHRKLNKTFAVQGFPIKEGYDEHENGNCELCKMNADDDESGKKYNEKEGLEISVCKDCCEQIVYIGTRLPKTECLIYGTDGKIPLFGKIRLELSTEVPSNLNNVFYMETLSDGMNFTRTRLARHLPSLTADELKDEKWFKTFETELKDWHFGSDNLPPKTFNMIAYKSKKEQGDQLVGRSLLGFLKADVDNMGLIFSVGLEKKLSAARLSSISRMLNIFFSEYLVELAKEEFPDIYVVFAGGDDLFVVGPWDQTIHFAIRLREKLSEFCSHNKDITMSAGIFIAKPRFPMRKAFELVEEYLKEAKNEPEKDSVSVLGETVSWQKLGELIKLGKKFDTAIEDKERTRFSTAFLYRLLTYHKMYRDFKRKPKILMKAGRYLSLAHYDIGRNIINDKKNNQEEVKMLHQIFAVGVSERPELEYLNIPLFYAINLNRD